MRRAAPRRLWSALRFPLLALERAALPDDGRPRVLVPPAGGRCTLLACDARARAAGLREGLTLKSAYGIVPTLAVVELDERARSRTLHALALWALGFSSRVTPVPPDTVLVEVGASLSLFGGLDALLARLRAGAAAQGLSLVVGTAPTPTAAELLARAGRESPIRTPGALAAAIADIAPIHLALDEDVARRLARAGIHSLAELLRVPPAALARRFGPTLMDRLYRLDGRLPDPRTPFLPPPVFAESVELPLEAPDTAALAFVINRLFGSLEGFLRARDLGARAVTIALHHRRHPPTRVELAFLDVATDAARLRRVATERLARTALVAPVARLALRATELAEVERDRRTLLGGAEGHGASVGEVIDALAARLGRARVWTVRVGDDHRPEKAWARAADAVRAAPIGRASAPRPLWLLREPVPASTALELVAVPERIEAGWWDTPDVRRDYFIARDRAGAYYWVYRLRGEPGRVWVHGVFA